MPFAVVTVAVIAEAVVADLVPFIVIGFSVLLTALGVVFLAAKRSKLLVAAVTISLLLHASVPKLLISPSTAHTLVALILPSFVALIRVLVLLSGAFGAPPLPYLLPGLISTT